MNRPSRASAKSPASQSRAKGLFISKRGTWAIRVKWKGLAKEYSEVTDLPATAPNIPAALAMRASRIQELKFGKTMRDVSVPFRTAASDFLKWYAGEHRDKPNTYKRANTSFASLIHHFGARVVMSIGAGDVEGYKTWRRECYIKEVTIRHDLHNLSAFFQYGKKLGWCKSNPIDDVDIPSDKDAVRINVLSPVMEAAYFSLAKKRSKDLYDLGRIMILAGCRPEEIMKLPKEEVDLFTRRFRVWGKSAASNRKIKMVGEVEQILLSRLNTPGKWVFPSPVKPGEHIVTLQRAHDEVVLQTGVNCTIYDFRHTFATRLAVQGQPLPSIAAALGHSSLSCLMKYVHPNQAHIDSVMDWASQNLQTDANDDFVKSGSGPTFDPLCTSKQPVLRLIRSNKRVSSK